MENQRRLFDSLSQRFAIQQLEDWYSIRVLDVKDNGGAGLLPHYGGSLIKHYNRYTQTTIGMKGDFMRQHKK